MVETAGWAHLGDEGTYLEVEFRGMDGAAKDISSATTLELWVVKQSGTEVALTAAFSTDGTNGKIRHQWATGELDETGLWRVQGHVEGSGFVYTTSRGLFRVRDTIDP